VKLQRLCLRHQGRSVEQSLDLQPYLRTWTMLRQMVLFPSLFFHFIHASDFKLGMQMFSLSPHCKTQVMSTEMCCLLACTLCFCFPYTPVHCHGDEPLVQNSTPLNCEATLYDYVIVNGRHFHASRTVGSNSSSLVHVTIPGMVPGTAYYGELLEYYSSSLDQEILFGLGTCAVLLGYEKK
jgi:hypothetical protein